MQRQDADHGAPLLAAGGWLLLSDRAEGAALPPLLSQGLFVVELELPLPDRAVLLEFHAHDGWERGFSLVHEPGVGLILRHRQGRSTARHLLPAPLPETSGTFRLSLRFDAPARHWDMRLEAIGDVQAPVLRARGGNPLPIRPADLLRLSQVPARLHRHPAVLWFGLTAGADLPVQAPWIGPRTPVDTPDGPVAAGLLRPGDRVMTRDDGPLPLLAVEPMELPACGSFAPILLRAPYFPQRHDILVSADQQVLLSGPEVEYLFGDEEVLLPATCLVDGQSVMAEQRRAVTSSVRLLFDRPALIQTDGCAMLCGLPEDIPPRRCLEGYEALTLLALLGRGHHRRRA